MSQKSRRPTFAVIGVLFFGLALPAEVAALPFLVIDQRNDAFPVTSGFGFADAPLGQEFTPSLTGLATVAIVKIREDSITGLVVGTSLPGVFGIDAIHFDFAALVALVPGNRYVIEPVLISGPGFGPVFSTTDTYAGGRGIVSGSPISDRDMGFREGLAVPEPASVSLLGVGIAVLAGRLFKRR